MIRPIFDGQPWAISRPRTIDETTVLDILGLLEFDAERERRAEKAAETDEESDASPEEMQFPPENDNPIELLYDFVLDALGVPPQGKERIVTGVHPRFTRTLSFSRDWFEALFYSDYLLEKEQRDLTLVKVVSLIRQEVASDLNRHFK